MSLITNNLPFQSIPNKDFVQVSRIVDHLNEGSFVPHRHRFYMLLWVTAGRGWHEVDFRGMEMLPGRVFPISEGQVHRIIHADADGKLLLFSNAAFEMLTKGEDGINAGSVFSLPFVDLNEEETTYFGCLWQLLQKTIAKHPSSPMLINQLRVLLGCLPVHATFTSVQNPFLQQLRRLISANFREQSRAAWYAEQLHIPLWKLNQKCRTLSGRNVSNMLAEHLVREAGTLLSTTELSVKEITFLLGQEDPSNFAKAFKRLTGMTPREYRCSRMQK